MIFTLNFWIRFRRARRRVSLADVRGLGAHLRASPPRRQPVRVCPRLRRQALQRGRGFEFRFHLEADLPNEVFSAETESIGCLGR